MRNWWLSAIRIVQRAEAVSAELASRPRVVSVHELIQRSDLVVEAASQAALLDFVPKALAAGRDMLIMSVGGLLGHGEWFSQAREKGCRILRAVRRHCRARWDQVRFDGLRAVGGAYQPQADRSASRHEVCGRERCSRWRAFRKSTVIFEGTAEEAARAFPDNVQCGGLAAAGSR